MDGLDGCYWVEPGRFLAGPYPHSDDRIARLRNLGVTLFLDLTETGEYGSPSYGALLGGGIRAVRKPLRDFAAPRPAQIREVLHDMTPKPDASTGVKRL